MKNLQPENKIQLTKLKQSKSKSFSRIWDLIKTEKNLLFSLLPLKFDLAKDFNLSSEFKLKARQGSSDCEPSCCHRESITALTLSSKDCQNLELDEKTKWQRLLKVFKFQKISWRNAMKSKKYLTACNSHENSNKNRVPLKKGKNRKTKENKNWTWKLTNK